MAEKELAVCDECGSLFFKGSSQMMGLCPECAHILYGYPNCDHHFQDGRCVNCYWDGSKSVYIKKQNQQEETDMPTTEWLNKYEAIKDKLTCKDDLEAHFTEKVIGNMAVDVLDIGTVHFPTGQIFACDPLVELEDTLPFLQTIPAGTYPVKICVVPSEQYGDRYACVKVEVNQEKPVRYELGMVGNEDLDEELGEDEYFGFLLKISDGFRAEEFCRLGLTGSSGDWERLVRGVIREFEENNSGVDLFHFDSDEDVFCVYSQYIDDLMLLSKMIRAACDNEKTMGMYLNMSEVAKA